MAGIFDRLGAADDSKIPIHYMKAVLSFVYHGVVPDAAAAINKLDNRLPVALAAAEQTDVTNIVAQLNGQADAAAKLGYILLFESAIEAVESKDLTDTQFRNLLNIA